MPQVEALEVSSTKGLSTLACASTFACMGCFTEMYPVDSLSNPSFESQPLDAALSLRKVEAGSVLPVCTQATAAKACDTACPAQPDKVQQNAMEP